MVTSSFRKLVLATGALFFAVVACEPDKDVEEPVGAPTPLELTRPRGFPAFPPTPDNPLTQEGVALGRHLFYEKQLSRNNTVSCGSCHQQSKAFTDGRAVSLGIDGKRGTRSSMTLANMAWERDLMWDGAATTLEQQARLPIENPVEMHQPLADAVRKLQQNPKYPALFRKAFGSATITEENVLKALSQFQRTLISANSKYDRFAATSNPSILTTDELRGFTLFRTHAVASTRGAECFHCHTLGTFAGPYNTFFNNGLDVTFADRGRGGVTNQPFDMGRFKAPTLRNIALTAPYMHDGRFRTLEEVLDHYSDHVRLNSPNLDPNLANSPNDPSGRMMLTATEKRQIIAFLHTLTDSTFINNPDFADPN
jgi:cytochrome c peroxidase